MDFPPPTSGKDGTLPSSSPPAKSSFLGREEKKNLNSPAGSTDAARAEERKRSTTGTRSTPGSSSPSAGTTSTSTPPPSTARRGAAAGSPLLLRGGRQGSRTQGGSIGVSTRRFVAFDRDNFSPTLYFYCKTRSGGGQPPSTERRSRAPGSSSPEFKTLLLRVRGGGKSGSAIRIRSAG